MAKQTASNRLSKLKTTHSATLDELEKYKLLVESVEDYAIFLLDPDGYIQTWNKGAQKNKGYLPEEIIGKHFSTFYLPDDIKAKKPERELVLARQLGRVEDEDWRVRKDGTQFWANVIITVLKDEQGEIVGFAKVTRDLTERKHNEDLLRTKNSLLKKQQKELEDLNISKDEFISLASHQLRTPATVVKQLLGMLTQGFMGELDPKHLATIQRAYEANERQIRIVENLLKVAQLDAGKVILRRRPTALRSYLADIVEEHASSITKRGQSIELFTADDIPKNILVDIDHFRMALGNLIDNASKYSYEGGKIIVRVNSSKDDVSISITDSGIGINPASQQEIFDKFARIPNELSEKVGGSGLGLYWVKRVVEMHEGTIDVSSQTGRGSTFTIRLMTENYNA